MVKVIDGTRKKYWPYKTLLAIICLMWTPKLDTVVLQVVNYSCSFEVFFNDLELRSQFFGVKRKRNIM